MPRKLKSVALLTRSPNHPNVTLRTAVELVRKIYDKESAAMVPLATAQESWGYKPGSSIADQCIAALRAYRLVHISASPVGRMIQVSGPARRILNNTPDADKMMQQLALKPPIHEELWNRYHGHLPPNEIMRHFLVNERKNGRFNEDAVDGFLARFRETLEYAGLAPSESDEFPESDQNARERIGPRLPPNAREDVFGLSEGDVVLQYPARLSQESFEDLRDWLQIEIRKIRRLVRG